MKTSTWTRLLDLISPRLCAVCGQRLTVNEEVLCAECHSHLPLTRYERKPLDNPMARLFWGLFPIEKASAYFFYEPGSEISQMIHDMKYRSHPEMAETLGVMAARWMDAAAFFEGIDGVVPMPITRCRRWQRGYNQCVEIAKGISSVTRLPVYKNVVERKRFHQSQTKLRGYERRDNVEGAFRLLRTNAVEGKHLLLVDDIITTGATVTACARELCKVPGVRVSVLSLGLTSWW